MKLTRRHQVMPAYAYCKRHGCEWTDTSSRIMAITETEAIRHVEATGHEVRVVTSRETIFTPAKLQAVSSRG